MKTPLPYNARKNPRRPEDSRFQKFFQKIKDSIKSSHTLSILLGEYLDETDEKKKKRLSYSINSRYKSGENKNDNDPTKVFNY